MSLATWLQGPATTGAAGAAGPAPVGSTETGAAGLPPFEPASLPDETAAPLEVAPAPVEPPAPRRPVASGSGSHPYGVGGAAGQDAPAGNPYLIGGVEGPSPADPADPADPARTPARKRRFVFAVMPALTFGISAVPSLNGSLFFGGRLRGDRWAVGYMGTLSLGLAERYQLGGFAHRHHLTALHNFGKRGFTSVGAGVGFFFFSPALVEAEARVGVRLGRQRRFILGGLMRLGYNFLYKEKAPMPQFGGFLGMSFL